MPSNDEAELSEDVIPLTSYRHEEDLDLGGIVSDNPPVRNDSRRSSSEESFWVTLNEQFSHQWRKVPQSWTLERDPSVALRHVLTLLGFLSLCIFVFSVPSILLVISPSAPTPPGTSPGLDEAASMITGKNGAVAADVPQCSELGVTIMRDFEGNAVDAMVAVVLCQGVLSPFASGLGGGAFILVHNPSLDNGLGRSFFYDALETAPGAATMSGYNNVSSSRFGGLAVAVPGELRGLYKAHSKHGKLEWKHVVAPVVQVADNAKVGAFLAIKLKQMNDTIFSSPSLKSIYTKQVGTRQTGSQQDAAAGVELPGVRTLLSNSEFPRVARGVADTLSTGSVVGDAEDKDAHGVAPNTTQPDDSNSTFTVQLLEEGDSIRNDALVQTLKEIGEHGPQAFYVNMSRTLAEEIQAVGGIVTESDIRNYKVEERRVVSSYYQGYEIIGAPIPSIGGTAIALALNMISELQFRKVGRNSVSYHVVAETLKWVFGAAMGLGDPQFVRTASSQMRTLLTRREAIRRVSRISPRRTYEPKKYANRVTSSKLEGGTSQISIIDKNGTAVSVTTSLNLPFGAGVVSNSTGVLLNDQMDSFTTAMNRATAFGVYPTNENRVEGGKRPASSMCPTIILKGRRVFMVLGGSGGPKAISGVLQTILNVIDFGDKISNAIGAPRLHHQLVPNSLSMESVNGTTCEQSYDMLRPSDGKQGAKAWTYWASVCENLKTIGHNIQGPVVHGAVQAVVTSTVIHDGDEAEGEEGEGLIIAASDPRRIGKAAAY